MSCLFTATPREREAITRISRRAADIMRRYIEFDLRLGEGDIMICLEACHCNGCPLRLSDMEQASEFDLIHDVAGICDHIDFATGKLEGCFLPRCADMERRASRHA